MTPAGDTIRSLSDGLLGAIPREQSGAETAERYEYQLHWALRELLRRHASGKNYCVLLEYFDDVVMLDDDQDPQHADFVQVKTKRSGHWTITELMKRGGKEKTELSPIGKMYAHRLSFPGASIALHFLSNVPLKVTLADGTSADAHPAVRCRDLADKDVRRLTAAVRAEHGITEGAAVDVAEITAFLFCEFGPQAAASAVVGELDRFLEQLFPLRKVRTSAVYQAIVAELRRRNNCRVRPESFGALISLHGMSRREFDGLMERVGIHDDPEGDWQAVEARIVHEGWPVAEQVRVRNAWRRYIARRTDHTDRQLQRFRSEIRRAIRTCHDRDDLTLREMVHTILQPVMSTPTLVVGYPPELMAAAALAELMTSYPEQHELPPTDSPPPASVGTDEEGPAARNLDGRAAEIGHTRDGNPSGGDA
jgi:hypothetical protein